MRINTGTEIFDHKEAEIFPPKNGPYHQQTTTQQPKGAKIKITK